MPAAAVVGLAVVPRVDFPIHFTHRSEAILPVAAERSRAEFRLTRTWASRLNESSFAEPIGTGHFRCEALASGTTQAADAAAAHRR
eukprot:141611-Pleurochrysis_carterae.AAC.3